MISEALELRVEGERVGHSRCNSVVSHGYGGLVGGSDGGGGWYACRTNPWGLIACRSNEQLV